MASSVSVLTMTYDDANRVTSETQQILSDGGPKSVTYGYDDDGARTSLTYPSGSTVLVSYDARHEAINVADSQVSATYAFDPNGNRISKALGNNTIVTYAYDDANRLSEINHQKAGASFVRFGYDYNAVNNRVSLSTGSNGASLPGQTETYAYDEIDQLLSVDYKSGDPLTTDRLVVYAYDTAGNRTSVTENGTATPYVANLLNEYTAVDGSNPTYDSAGNLKALHGWTYNYDAQNRLVSAVSAQTSLTFAYDPRNRCVSRTINDATVFHYYDGWRILEEQDPAGNVLARYVNGAEMDEIISRVAPGATIYYHHDALGSVRTLTDSAGDVVEKYGYDAFGTPTIKSAADTVLNSSAVGNRFLFAGRELVPQTGLYDYRNRSYSPELGRFLQTDPTRFGGGDKNLYSFVANNPAGLKDPFGLLALDVATYYTYHQFIDRSREIGGLTSIREPEVTADCKCDNCGQYVLDQLRVTLTMDVQYAQGYGSQFRAFVQAHEPDHENELRAWADNDGKNKAQIQEDQLKKTKFTSQEQCQSGTSQAAKKRISDGWHQAAKDSHDKHDLSGGDHQYMGPLFD